MNRRTLWILVSGLLAIAACTTSPRPPAIDYFDGHFAEIHVGDGSQGDGVLGDGALGDGAIGDGTMGDGGNGTDAAIGCDGGLAACGGACVDLLNDATNCSHCGMACLGGPNETAVCRMGACQPAVCNPGFGNCDGMTANGCETPLSTVTNCGSCNNLCSAPTPLCVSASGIPDGGVTDGGGMDAGAPGYACGAMCLAGTTPCGSSCVDLQTDPTNCGMCGMVCTAGPNSSAACTTGACGISCGSGFADCNHMSADGCETETDNDVMNCGMCGMVCPTHTHFTAACTSSMCRGACEMLWGDCNMDLTDGCELDLSSNLDNCGGCGQRCRVTNGTSSCTMGVCMITCNPGYYQSGLMCLPIPAPRLVGPISGSFVTSRRPVLSWDRGTVADSFRVEICSDNLCAHLVTMIDSNGSYVTPSADLTPGVLFWRARGGKDGSYGLMASNVWEFVVGARTSSPSQSPWGALFDANADGLGDIAVGAPGSSGAYVYAGTTSNVATTAAVTLTGSGAGYGQSIIGAGDVNGDGFSDLLVGAPGSAQVSEYLGSATGIATVSSSMVTGGTGFGAALSPGGDLNADGFGDVIVGDPGSNTARVYTGSIAGLTSTFLALHAPTSVTASFGTAVAGLGDTNGDGLSDVAVSAPSSNAVYVFIGARVSGAVTLSSAIFTRIAAPPGATGFGSSVSCAGDVNSDGYMDLVVGAPTSGGVYIYDGALAGIATTPSATLIGPTGVSFGFAVQGIGDVDGDGYDDVAVGTLGTNPILVFHGGAMGMATTAGDTIPGPAGIGASGLSIGGAVLGTGASRSSILLGDSANNRVLLYLPGASTLSTTPGVTLSQTSGQFGAAVYSAFH